MTARLLVAAAVALAPLGLVPLIGTDDAPASPQPAKSGKASKAKGSKSGVMTDLGLTGMAGLLGASSGREVELTSRDALPEDVQTVLRRHEREVRNRARAVAPACGTAAEVSLEMGVAGQLQCRAYTDGVWTDTHVAAEWGPAPLVQPQRFATVQHDPLSDHCCRVEVVTPSTFAPDAVDLSVEVPYDGGVARLFVALPL